MRSRIFTLFYARIFSMSLFILCFDPGRPVLSADDSDHLISIQLENDFFGGGSDRHFTHGTRIEYLSAPIKWITDAANKFPNFNLERTGEDQKDAVTGRASLSMGQNIFTPADTTSSQLVAEGRPYAGWLYFGFGFAANQGSRRYDKLELEIGVVGPLSFAEEVQTFWHSLFGLNVPRGWDNQLNNEPGVVLYYQQAHRFDRKNGLQGLDFDVIPYFGGSLGNVFTYAAAGFFVRIGHVLDEDFGPPRIRPSLPGGTFFRPRKGFNWNLFAGVEGRVVLRNIFLDGNTFAESHAVDKRTLVADFQTGIELLFSRFRVSYTQIFRTKEFDQQAEGDVFGSLSFSYAF
jgi:hypothetical protein